MNVHVIASALLSFMEQNGYSQTRLSNETGIPQPTISRALHHPVRITKTHRALCKFAKIPIERNPATESMQEELVGELLDVWDGTREHANLIARLLRSAAGLEAHAADRIGKPRKSIGHH
jgi:hypothetical protein